MGGGGGLPTKHRHPTVGFTTNLSRTKVFLSPIGSSALIPDTHTQNAATHGTELNVKHGTSALLSVEAEPSRSFGDVTY